MLGALDLDCEDTVRGLAIFFAILATGGFAANVYAAGVNNSLRFAQTSTTTYCMLACNSTAASCQAACVVPGTAPTGAATATSNANASASCLLNCSTEQLACQTTCARISPSQ